MSLTLSYPGVYVEELPSGVHTIAGVPTSITAFVGRALKGPVNTPVTINSYGDFGRIFGGLGLGYPMTYGVRDFFANGGGQGIIVRVYSATSLSSSSSSSSSSSASSASSSSASSMSSSSSAFVMPEQADGIARMNEAGPDSIGLALQASSPGAWGNSVSVYVAVQGLDPSLVQSLGYSNAADLFDLIATDTASGLTETIRNVSTVNGSRRVDQVLLLESSLIRVQTQNDGTPILPSTTPKATPKPAPPPKPPSPPGPGGSWPMLGGGDDGTVISDPLVYVPADGSKHGIYALENADLFNLLSIPPDTPTWTASSASYSTVYQYALQYCKKRRAVLIVDPPADWLSVSDATAGPSALNLVADGDYGAIYFPQLIEPDPLRKGQTGMFAPSGAVAGVIAQTDGDRGVWKAPAGISAGIIGLDGLSVTMTDDENGELNPLGVNCLRTFPFVGTVVWGARTMRGADALTDDYKYLPVRRLALYIEESLYRGTKWVVFEPNDEALWSQIRLNVGAFMRDLFRKGAFQGTTPQSAYLVKCDSETTTQTDINNGIVNILVAFAPVKPAEFVVLQIQQLAGQAA